MHPYVTLIAFLALAAASTAQAQPSPSPEELAAIRAERANIIVGVWDSQVVLGPCAGAAGPTRRFRGLNTFHLGGTLSDTNSAPPGSRGPGMGTWDYDLTRRVHRARMTFFRYLPDGSFDGTAEVHRDITLSADGNQSTEVAYARAIRADGSLLGESCGSVTGRRIAVE